MNRMRLIPAMKYQLNYIALSSAIAFGIMTIVYIINYVITFGIFSNFDINIIIFSDDNGISIGSMLLFMVFVMSISTIREDLRFLLQHGMGRSTTLFSTLLAGLIMGCILGLICKLLDLITTTWPAFMVHGFTTNEGNFFSDWIIFIALYVLTWQLGALISLIYYRLSGIYQAIISVFGGLAIIIVIPTLVVRLTEAGFKLNILSNPYGFIGVAFLLTIIITVFNLLLVRGTQIKGL